MVSNSWLRGFWTTSKKKNHGFETENSTKIAVLAFEAASLMRKLLQLWQSLSDKQVSKTREEITSSIGIKNLVSEDEDYLGKLICKEMTENLVHVARSLSRLSKKCQDPLLRSFERAFNDLVRSGNDPYGWRFSWKKMDEKAKKMERFVAANASLYQEMENLADLEQNLKRIRACDNLDGIALVEYEKKVAYKIREVKHLKQSSLWARTYDYAILLLARSLFTVYARIGHVFDGSGPTSVYYNSTVLTHSSVYPSENYLLPRFSYGPSTKPASASGPLIETNRVEHFHSGPLPNSSPFSGAGFYSGPLGKSSTKANSSPGSKTSKGTAFKLWQLRKKPTEKGPRKKPNDVAVSGPITGPERSSPLNLHSREETKPRTLGNLLRENRGTDVSSKNEPSGAPPEILGAAGLAIHYANLITFIEKLASTPHLIGNDARDDLYSMLPSTVRATLRAKLKPYASRPSPPAYDAALADEWTNAVADVLGWLAPMAHDTIRWQSERSFEHQNSVPRANMLLVKTLYFANQEKTEAAITELLVGLNYVWRFGREINAKPMTECVD